MPLISLRYTKNLTAHDELKSFLVTANEIIATSVNTDIHHCKAALIPHEDFCIGDGKDASDVFIILTVELMVGRTHEIKTALSAKLLAALKESLKDHKTSFTYQIGCHIKDLDPHHYEKSGF